MLLQMLPTTWTLLFLHIVGAQITLLPITNPLLSFLVSKAKLIKQKHTYVKYIDLQIFEDPLKAIEINMGIIPNISEKDESSPSLLEIFNHLKYLHKKALDKYTNLKPVRRQKRGLINVVGKAYNWAFGLLDSDDAARYDNAIKTLDKNQQKIHHDLKNMLTITKEFMNETNNVIGKILTNQNQIYGQIKILQDKINKNVLFLKLQNWINVMIIDCQNMIEILDSLENSVLFARLNIVNNNILSLIELDNILESIKLIYPNGIVNFEYKQSYLEIIKIEVLYVQSKLLFNFHIPIVNENLFDYYKLFPIPNKGEILIPPEPYIIIDNEDHYFLREACNIVEDYCIYYEKTPNKFLSCIPQLLRGNQLHNCSTIMVNSIHKTLVEPVDGANVIIVPAKTEKITKQCPHQEYAEISEPHLIKIPKNCRMVVGNYSFGNNDIIMDTKPIDLLPIRTTVQLSSRDSPLILQEIHTDRLADVYNSAKSTHIQDLESVKLTTDSSNILLYIVITIVFILCILLLYRYCLKNKKQITHMLIRHKNVTNKEETPMTEKNEIMSENKEKTHPLFST